MGRAQIIVLIVAAVCAIGLALIVGSMLKHNKSAPAAPVQIVQAPAQPMARVVVAHQDLTIGHRLAAGDLVWQDWPADGVNAAYITDGQGVRVQPARAPPSSRRRPADVANTAAAAVSGAQSPMDALYGSIVREPILANEPITNAKLVRGGEGNYLAVVLKPGMRAVAVSVSNDRAAGGFILPGDHVDVIQSRQANNPAAVRTTTSPRPCCEICGCWRSTRPPSPRPARTPCPRRRRPPSRCAPPKPRCSPRPGPRATSSWRCDPTADANGPTGRGGEAVENEGQVKIFRAGQAPEVMVLQ